MNSLEQLFGSKTRFRLLQLFFRNPEGYFYVREITRMLNSQINAVRRELSHLEQLGIIAEMPGSPEDGVMKGGRQKYYAVNHQSLLYSEIKALLEKSRLMEENAHIEAIKEKGGKLSLFVLTGLFIGNHSAPTDMLLVGAVKQSVVKRLIGKFEKDLGQHIRYTTMTTREYLDRKHLMDKFLYQALEGPVIEVIKFEQ